MLFKEHVFHILYAECNDALVWQALYDKAVEIARDVDVEPAMPRQNGRQRILIGIMFSKHL